MYHLLREVDVTFLCIVFIVISHSKRFKRIQVRKSRRKRDVLFGGEQFARLNRQIIRFF